MRFCLESKFYTIALGRRPEPRLVRLLSISSLKHGRTFYTQKTLSQLNLGSVLAAIAQVTRTAFRIIKQCVELQEVLLLSRVWLVHVSMWGSRGISECVVLHRMCYKMFHKDHRVGLSCEIVWHANFLHFFKDVTSVFAYVLIDM